MSDRRFLVAGNWKMHHTGEVARAFADRLRAAAIPEGVDVVLFPSFPLLARLTAWLDGTAVGIGGQDLHPAEQGAHTGDVSGRQLLDAGCVWVLCGHSERRSDHAEGDGLVAEKVEAAWREGLRPVLCVGETLEQREAGKTETVLQRQLDPVLFSEAGPKELVVAYEPVWAIGTGKTATPEQAQEGHAFLRRRLEAALGRGSAQSTRILYGGSVKPENCASLAAQPDIDGFLIGGASLDPDSFLDIIDRCSS